MDEQKNLALAFPIALQLWTIRDALAADAGQAFGRVKSAGFSALELAPLPPGQAVAQLADLIERHGLKIVSIHADLPTHANIDSLRELTRACRCRKIIWHGWPRDPCFDSLAGLGELITRCNRANALAREHGLKFGMHNHWWEFELLEGASPIRILHEELHADIFWQLDVYWAQTAGADPAAIVADLQFRIGSIHWKDGPCVPGKPMTALGRGDVDVPRILGALTRRVDWVIELDDCATDPLEAAKQGRVYLEAEAEQHFLGR
jgi:sugar phosphate isomerase/epimerase